MTFLGPHAICGRNCRYFHPAPKCFPATVHGDPVHGVRRWKRSVGTPPPFWHTWWVEVTIRHSLGVQICCVWCSFVVETRCAVARVLNLE